MNMKKNSKIWIGPACLFLTLAAILIVVYFKAAAVVPNTQYKIGVAELALALAVYSMFLVSWYIVMIEYEHVMHVHLKRRIRGYWRFFLSVYVVSILMVAVKVAGDYLPVF